MLLSLLLISCSDPPTPEPPSAEPAAPEPSAPAAAGTESGVSDITPEVPKTTKKSPVPLGEDPRWDEIIALLRPVVERYTADADNPWAIGHGFVALGKDLQIDGKPAIDLLYARFAEVDAAGRVTFPANQGSIRIEPHPELMLKAVTEAGFEPTRKVQVDGTTVTLADHYRGTLHRTTFNMKDKKSSFPKPNDMPWALQAIATWAPEPELSWTGDSGSTTSLDELTTVATRVLQQETAFLAEAHAKNGTFERKGQGIFTYTCGGAHMLQGAAYAVARGYGSPRDRQLIEQQVVLHFYRYPIESQITKRAMDQLPEHRDKLLVQRLKFSGHFLESMHKLAALDFYEPTASQKATLQQAADEVHEVAGLMKKAGLLDDLTEIRKRDEQLYLDIVGDSAHALKGLALARGQDAVRY